jgi:hypothetical protein
VSRSASSFEVTAGCASRSSGSLSFSLSGCGISGAAWALAASAAAPATAPKANLRKSRRSMTSLPLFLIASDARQLSARENECALNCAFRLERGYGALAPAGCRPANARFYNHEWWSSPAHAGDPVRRGFSVQTLLSLEYWIVRRSLSSGGHSADPLADDDDRMCVLVLATQFASELFRFIAPLAIEGAGNAGCALHPRSRVRCLRNKKVHTSIQVSGGSPTSPAQWLYGLYRALPGERACCHHRLAETSARLDASIAAPGPHDFAVRPCPVVCRTSASTASHPNVW